MITPPKDQKGKSVLEVAAMLYAIGEALDVVDDMPRGSARIQAFLEAYRKANKEFIGDRS